MKIKYQICTNCVMDISDTEIYFDEKGICNHCNTFYNVTSKEWFPNESGKNKLNSAFDKQAKIKYF